MKKAIITVLALGLAANAGAAPLYMTAQPLAFVRPGTARSPIRLALRSPLLYDVVTAAGVVQPGASSGGISGALTSGRIPIANGGSSLTDDSDLTFSVDTLTVTKIAGTTLTGTNVATGRTTFGTAADAANAVDLGETAGRITFEGSTADAVESRFGATDPTSGDQMFLLPDAAAAGTYTVALQTDVQSFTTPGANTWNKPAGAKTVCVVIYAAGGSGGGGAGGAAAGVVGQGGSGGGGGARVEKCFNAAEVSTPQTVTIGAGSSGGNAGGAGGADGSDGTAGGNTTFGSILIAFGGGAGFKGKLVAAAESGGAGGGSAGAGANGGTGTAAGGLPGAGAGTTQAESGGGSGSTDSVGTGGLSGGGGGGAGRTAGGAGQNGGNSMYGAAGGAGGGGVVTGNTNSAGGTGGGTGATVTYQGSGGGATAGSAGAAFNANQNGAAGDSTHGGQGGGGGGGRRDGTAAAKGGDGGLCGGGGAGGGGGQNSTAGGAGGAGGAGCAYVFTYR